MIKSGIYKIENSVNGKLYVGSSSEIPNRKYNHFNTLRKNEHPNSHLQNAYNKYGKDAFEFAILEEVKDLTQLILREQYWMDLAQHEESRLYNHQLTANPSLGHAKSPVTSARISATLKRRGIKPPSRKGVRMTEEQKAHYRFMRSVKKLQPLLAGFQSIF